MFWFYFCSKRFWRIQKAGEYMFYLIYYRRIQTESFSAWNWSKFKRQIDKFQTLDLICFPYGKTINSCKLNLRHRLFQYRKMQAANNLKQTHNLKLSLYLLELLILRTADKLSLKHQIKKNESSGKRNSVL
jgi:hypothetical protein